MLLHFVIWFTMLAALTLAAMYAFAYMNIKIRHERRLLDIPESEIKRLKYAQTGIKMSLCIFAAAFIAWGIYII